MNHFWGTNKLLYWIAGAFLLFSCIRVGLWFIHFSETNAILVCDFHWRWQECAYLLKGVNPMDVIHHQVPADPDIGYLSPIAGTVPWAYVLGNLLVFGFLPYDVALILGFAIFPVVAVITAVVIYRYVSGITDKAWGFLAAALVLICPYWPYSYIQTGNYGTLCTYLIVMTVMLSDRRPVLAGVLLALASLKPHLAFLFYISLFFQGRWKTLFTASTIVLASWVIASLLAGVSPTTMLLEMSEQGANYYNVLNGDASSFVSSYYGIFTVLIDGCHMTISECLLASAIFGIFVVASLSYWFIKTGLIKGNELLYFSIPAVVSTIWSYAPAVHRSVLMLLVMAYMICLYRSRLSMKARAWLVFFVIAFYSLHGNAIASGINRILAFAVQKTGWGILEHLMWFNNFFLYAGMLGFLLIATIVVAWRLRPICRE